ncbi:hypothetical protein [Sigmofec virus UA08Rod_4043]|uniref:Uncharacterized protein n=1 Tax=Sigmofec virus UA08Rod_4043 TaxID=2929393 RepID=A0A976R8N6_9VIRU|nr:hypothetical protein [Sigmofec virus UA08Rod_4043]
MKVKTNPRLITLRDLDKLCDILNQSIFAPSYHVVKDSEGLWLYISHWPVRRDTYRGIYDFLINEISNYF